MPIAPHRAHSKASRFCSSPATVVRTILMGLWHCWRWPCVWHKCPTVNRRPYPAECPSLVGGGADIAGRRLRSECCHPKSETPGGQNGSEHQLKARHDESHRVQCLDDGERVRGDARSRPLNDVSVVASKV
jgi:hypothetical protein